MAKVVRKWSPGSVYVGRPSIFGNPFVIGKDGSRAEVIEKYRVWFNAKVQTDLNFAKAVQQLKGQDLACWCAPQACHADVILEYLSEL
jgi:hypothetical protein